MRPYDDPRSVAPPLKAINPYNKHEVAQREERKRQQIVDPRAVSTLLGVSERGAAVTKATTVVQMAVQAIQR